VISFKFGDENIFTAFFQRTVRLWSPLWRAFILRMKIFAKNHVSLTLPAG
jgi:hypothetical protein